MYLKLEAWWVLSLIRGDIGFVFVVLLPSLSSLSSYPYSSALQTRTDRLGLRRQKMRSSLGGPPTDLIDAELRGDFEIGGSEVRLVLRPF